MKTKKLTKRLWVWCLVLMLAISAAGCGPNSSVKSTALDIDYVGDDGTVSEEEVSAKSESPMEWLKKKLSSDKKKADKNSGRTETASTSDSDSESDGLRARYGLTDETAKDDSSSADSTSDAKTAGSDQENTPAQKIPTRDTDGSVDLPVNDDKNSSNTQKDQIQTKKNTVTFTIRCDTAVANGMAKEAKWAGIVPASGCILPVITMEFEDGETVFDLLCRIRDTYKLQMEYSGANGGEYIEGINNLYEFDGGRWSGWMYCVNDWYPNYGCGQYKVAPGDVIEWNYTCDLGCDLENGDPYGYGKEWKENHD